MKKSFLFLFIQVLASIFLTSESFAFTNTSESSIVSFQEKNATIQNALNHNAFFIEEIASVKTFEQEFYPRINFFSERISRIYEIPFISPLLKNRNTLFFKNNSKKLLTQQIFPYHLFW